MRLGGHCVHCGGVLRAGLRAGADHQRRACACLPGQPTTNAERARLRSTDETVAQALSGYRPQISPGLTAGLMDVRNLMPGVTDTVTANLKPWSAGLTINQTIFNGMKTGNQVRQAESQVQSGREQLRGVEQNVLLDAVTAYMSVIANQSLVEAQKANVQFLRDVVQTTYKRYDAGDVTPTDVAQSGRGLTAALPISTTPRSITPSARRPTRRSSGRR